MTDWSEKRTGTMSHFTRCKTYRRAPNPMPLGSAIRIVMVLAIVTVFAVAHLHLRFNLNRMNTETMRLQSRQGALTSELNALRSETAALKSQERLLDYAHSQLGMVSYNLMDQEKLHMQADVYTRYAMARASRTAQAADWNRPDAEASAIWLEAVSERIGLISPALARDSNGTKTVN